MDIGFVFVVVWFLSILSRLIFLDTEVSQCQRTSPDEINDIDDMGTINLESPQINAQQNLVHIF